MKELTGHQRKESSGQRKHQINAKALIKILLDMVYEHQERLVSGGEIKGKSEGEPWGVGVHADHAMKPCRQGEVSGSHPEPD